MKRITAAGRILIVRTDRLGDVVLTLPMATALKREMPSAHVTFFASDYTAPIIRLAPDVDETVTIPTSASFWNLVRQFRATRADCVFFPNARFDQALAAFVARIPVRIGTAYRWYSFLYNRRQPDHRRHAERNEAEYNLRQLAQIGVKAEGVLPRLEVPSDAISKVQQWLSQSGVDQDAFGVLHIPSGKSSKDWSADRFIELSAALRMPIVLTGIQSDAEFLLSIAERIRLGDTSVHLFVGKPLEELAALFTFAKVVVANSTGPGHLAAAIGAPTVGLFPLPKALSKERWGFRGMQAVNLSPFGLAQCPNCSECSCMERLSLEEVLMACNRIFGDSNGSGAEG